MTETVNTLNSVRHMLDNVFNYVSEEASNDAEYWWAPTHSRQGWIVAWLEPNGLETLHTYHYPPEVWGGLGVDTP